MKKRILVLIMAMSLSLGSTVSAAAAVTGKNQCAGRYFVDADGDGICDNCVDVDQDGVCDNFVDAELFSVRFLSPWIL